MKTQQIIHRAMAGVLALGVTAASGQALAAAAPYGSMTTAAPSRTITIDGNTRHINVMRFETVALRHGNGEHTVWTFDTLGTASFPLSKIVPGTDGVTVYVGESQLYTGN